MEPSMAGGKMLLVCGNVHDNKRGWWGGGQCVRWYQHNIHILNKSRRLKDGWGRTSVEETKGSVRCWRKQCVPGSRDRAPTLMLSGDHFYLSIFFPGAPLISLLRGKRSHHKLPMSISLLEMLLDKDKKLRARGSAQLSSLRSRG